MESVAGRWSRPPFCDVSPQTDDRLCHRHIRADSSRVSERGSSCSNSKRNEGQITEAIPASAAQASEQQQQVAHMHSMFMDAMRNDSGMSRKNSARAVSSSSSTSSAVVLGNTHQQAATIDEQASPTNVGTKTTTRTKRSDSPQPILCGAYDNDADGDANLTFHPTIRATGKSATCTSSIVSVSKRAVNVNSNEDDRHGPHDDSCARKRKEKKRKKRENTIPCDWNEDEFYDLVCSLPGVADIEPYDPNSPRPLSWTRWHKGGAGQYRGEKGVKRTSTKPLNDDANTDAKIK